MTFRSNSLTLPKRKSTKDKLRAYAKHWDAIARIQEEFNHQFIHQDLSTTEVSENSQIGFATVNRFRNWGRGNGKMTYSYFHGPTATTIFGIASAIGMEIHLKRKKPNGKAQ